MKEFLDCLISTNGMAFGTGVLIFLITLILVTRKWIGFTLALLLLLVALGASFAVANKDKVQKYYEDLNKPKENTTYKANETPSKEEGKKEESTFSEKLDKVYEDLKGEYETLKEKIQSPTPSK